MGEGGRGGLESLINKSRDNAKNRKTIGRILMGDNHPHFGV